MKNKALKWILGTLIVLIATVVLILAGFSLFDRIAYLSFYTNSERYEKMPGLWDGYVHQGYTEAADGVRLACGYMKDGGASRVYILDGEKNDVFVELKNADGTDYAEHTGGIAVYGDVIYITGKTGADIFSYADLTDGDGIATKISEFATPNDPAYCTVYNDSVYFGSFYRPSNYETPENHRFTTPAGDKNTAIISVYHLDTVSGLPLSDTPDEIYSTTGLVQGLAFTDEGDMILSTSYGISKSRLYVYDISKAISDTVSFGDDNIFITYLDSHCLDRVIVAPPMSEELIYKDGTVCIMNESASMKYLFGKLTSGNYVYGYKLK